MTRRILTLFFAITLALTVTGQVFARGRNDHPHNNSDKNTPGIKALGSLAASQCFSSGSGLTLVKVCITNNGNVSYFESPAGYVHLNGREGYAVCTQDDQQNWIVHGFDVNFAADGWGSSTVSQPKGPGTFPLIVTRQTLDGLLQLKQTFNANWKERGMDVKMDVKNTSGSVMSYIRLTRSADVDISGVSQNTFEMTDDSATGLAVDGTNRFMGLMLTADPGTSGHGWAMNITYSDWDPYGAGAEYARGCAAGRDFGGYGDYVSAFHANMEWVNPGETRSATLRYRRF